MDDLTHICKVPLRGLTKIVRPVTALFQAAVAGRVHLEHGYSSGIGRIGRKGSARDQFTTGCGMFFERDWQLANVVAKNIAYANQEFKSPCSHRFGRLPGT